MAAADQPRWIGVEGSTSSVVEHAQFGVAKKGESKPDSDDIRRCLTSLFGLQLDAKTPLPEDLLSVCL